MVIISYVLHRLFYPDLPLVPNMHGPGGLEHIKPFFLFKIIKIIYDTLNNNRNLLTTFGLHFDK